MGTTLQFLEMKIAVEGPKGILKADSAVCVEGLLWGLYRLRKIFHCGFSAYYSCSILIAICSRYWLLIEQLRMYVWRVTFAVLYHMDCYFPNLKAKLYNFSLIPELLLSCAA